MKWGLGEAVMAIAIQIKFEKSETSDKAKCFGMA